MHKRATKRRVVLLLGLLFACMVSTFPLTRTAQAADVLLTWTPRTVPNDSMESIVWSPELGKFVGVGPNVAMTSTDGITWTTHTAPNGLWSGVTWSPELNLFVAVLYDETTLTNVMTSPDGENWTPRQGAIEREWDAVTWSPELGLFVAIPNDSAPMTNYVMVSPDGINWTTHAIPAGAWWDIVWSPELAMFVAVSPGDGTAGEIMVSTDGTNWAPPASVDAPKEWTNIEWSPELGMFVVTSTTEFVAVSTDGQNWTTHSIPSPGDMLDVAWAPELGIFVAVGQAGTQRIITSSDGINWIPHTAPGDSEWNIVTWSPELELFAAFSYRGTDAYMTGIPSVTAQAPPNVHATASGSNTINLSWDTPNDDGGAPITGYMIERSIVGGSFTVVVANTGSANTTYQDTGLDPNTEYIYRVSAINAAGTSGWSNTASATTFGVSSGMGGQDGSNTLAATGNNTPSFIILGSTLVVASGAALIVRFSKFKTKAYNT